MELIRKCKEKKICPRGKFRLVEIRLKVDFHLVENIARATFSFCLTSSQIEPSTNLFNFNNAAVVRATFWTNWKSTFKNEHGELAY